MGCYRHNTCRARKLTKDHRSFVLKAVFTKPGQKLMAHVGVDEVSGCATVAEFDPCLPEEAFPVISSARNTDLDKVSRLLMMLLNL